jgi:hypothetical protein
MQAPLWWAIALLDIPEGSVEWKIRAAAQAGRVARVEAHEQMAAVWFNLKHRAQMLADRTPIEAWREKAWEQREKNGQPAGPIALAVRDAMLYSERAFVEWADLRDDEGKQIVLADFHIEVLRAMRQCDPAAVFVPLEHGKLVSHLSPIITPNGKTVHGNLRPGDYVFGPDGRPTKVVAIGKEDVATMRVTFSDGESIDCHPNHEWRVYDRSYASTYGSDNPKCWRVLTTKHIAGKKYRSGNRSLLQVEYTEPLEFPHADQPMDPYTLGLWLGNGSVGKGLISRHSDDSYEVPYTTKSVWKHPGENECCVTYVGLREHLQSLGVLADKHIPHAYLWASRQQRWDLLCGLMDSDGSVDDRGRCRFVNTNLALIEGVEHLLRTFGIRTRRLVAEPALSSSGVQGLNRVYTVAFAPATFPFRMQRKLAKCKVSKLKHTRRGIVSIEEIPPVPGRCIQVERPDGMYLVGETLIPTHNSYLSSIVVCLMDWAEWNNATETRIYWNDKLAEKWTVRLQSEVQYNDNLQRVFPWIRKPTRDDKATSWGSEGFAIGGRDLADRSFEPLTARGYSVGNRYSRVGADDWVTVGNAGSLNEQDKLLEYFFSGVMSMPQKLRRVSKYGTIWSSCYYIGTLYDRRDCGYRLSTQLRANGEKVIVRDVYPEGAANSHLVLWPEGRDAEYISKKRANMLPKSFNARFRNMVVDDSMETFTADDVDEACSVSLESGGLYAFGKVPHDSYAFIGYDPASGKRTRYSADPAICVYAEVPDRDDEGIETGGFSAHFVEWERLQGYDFPRQCQTIVNWSRRLLLPVVIEKNTLQGAYREYIRQLAPDVRVYDHQTQGEKWNSDDGVETFAPLFRNKRAVIHADQAPQSELRALQTQLIEWPQSAKTDLIMAFWFARARLRKRQKARSRPSIVPDSLPDYVAGRDRYWNAS